MQALGRTYDSLGRVTKVTSYAGTTTGSSVRNEVETVYDALGQVTQSYQAHGGATSGSSPSVQYAYDTSAVSNVYDDALRPTSTTYPNGSRQILYHYGSSGSRSDLLSRMEKIQEGSTDLTQYAYNGTGRLVNTKLLPPGVESLTGTSSSNFSYLDQWGRVRQTRWFKSSTSSHADSVLYTYDRAGNRVLRDVQMNLINNSYTDERDQTYEYDLLNRLKSADQKAGSTVKLKQAWGLDQLGNWSAFQQDGKNDYSAVYNNSYADTADLNQTRKHNVVNEIDNDNDHANSPSSTITNGGGQSAWALPAYDGSGNMTSMPKPKSLGSNYTVKYDAWNRLSTVADGGTVIQTNRYDGLHRRVSRESNTTGVRHFYWNEQWQCVEERTGTSTTADRQYVWHPYYIDALAISYNSSGTAHYYVQDGNFNVTAAMDSSGAVVERYSYTPYGECIVLNADFTLDSSSGGDGLSDIANEFTYTGRRLDVETGLYQYRYRYYHAQLGRFVNRDPIGYRGSPWNVYRYVKVSPLSNVDPFGLQMIDPDKIDDVRDLLDTIEDFIDAIDPNELPEPTLPIGPDDIIGIGSGQIDVVIDLVFEFGKEDSPCKKWLKDTFRSTLCASASCRTDGCSKISPSTSWDQEYPPGNYRDCIEGILKDKPVNVQINTRQGFWNYSQKLRKKCKDAPSNSKCCAGNPIKPLKDCPTNCKEIRQKCSGGK